MDGITHAPGRSTEASAEDHRRHERLRIGGTARLILESSTGSVTRTGQTVDLSASGCALRVYKPVPEDFPVQVEFEVANMTLSLPATICWVRDDKHSFRVGCRFDRLIPEKAAALEDLLRKRRQRAW